jgi:hypothetical protein
VNDEMPAGANPRAVKLIADFQGMTHGSWCELAPAAESVSDVALLFTVNNVQ